jgi:hypothetical protein
MTGNHHKGSFGGSGTGVWWKLLKTLHETLPTDGLYGMPMTIKVLRKERDC